MNNITRKFLTATTSALLMYSPTSADLQKDYQQQESELQSALRKCLTRLENAEWIDDSARASMNDYSESRYVMEADGKAKNLIARQDRTSCRESDVAKSWYCGSPSDPNYLEKCEESFVVEDGQLVHIITCLVKD